VPIDSVHCQSTAEALGGHHFTGRISANGGGARSPERARDFLGDPSLFKLVDGRLTFSKHRALGSSHSGLLSAAMQRVILLTAHPHRPGPQQALDRITTPDVHLIRLSPSTVPPPSTPTMAHHLSRLGTGRAQVPESREIAPLEPVVLLTICTSPRHSFSSALTTPPGGARCISRSFLLSAFPPPRLDR
jgi:hypothetical protein